MPDEWLNIPCCLVRTVKQYNEVFRVIESRIADITFQNTHKDLINTKHFKKLDKNLLDKE